jgi:hypothetical protein
LSELPISSTAFSFGQFSSFGRATYIQPLTPCTTEAKRQIARDLGMGRNTVDRILSEKVYHRVMDSAGKGMNADEERSYFDAYREAGIYFRPAKKNRDLSGFDLIAEALRPTSFVAGNEKKMKPRLTIMTGNEELVWQISHLRFSEWRGGPAGKGTRKTPASCRLSSLSLRPARPSAVC